MCRPKLAPRGIARAELLLASPRSARRARREPRYTRYGSPMTRASHYVIGLASAVALAGWLPSGTSVLIGVGIAAGANLPDDLELPRRKDAWGNARPPVIPHRTVTHWPWWYAVALVALAACHRSPFALLALGVALGSIVHLLCDSVSPHGIPWLAPFSALKPPFTVYTTRKASEWSIVLPVLLVAIAGALHGWSSFPDSVSEAFSVLVQAVAPQGFSFGNVLPRGH